MSSFTTRKDFWGNTIYYDKGKEIGREETNLLGTKGIYKDGHKVADLESDHNGNREIVFRSNSLFGSDKRMTDKNRRQDWEFCEVCGEWDGEDDEDGCDSCGHKSR